MEDGWTVSFEHFCVSTFLSTAWQDTRWLERLLNGSMALRGFELHDTHSIEELMF
jgi:hypothetical protein